MNILVTGASGFIAAQIVTDLLAAGHHVTCCVRNLAYEKNIFPTAKIIKCDFVNDTTSEQWLPRLENIEAVVNCVGILHHPRQKVIWAVHTDTPRALFAACVQSGVKKIIHLSALGIDQPTNLYAQTKKAAEDYLLALPIPAIILRPSLVYGRGSYGGTSLFRGLAALPGIIPIPGNGEQQFQPIHLEDLSQAVLRLIAQPLADSVILSAVGPKRVTLCQILSKIRAWLGFSPAKLFFVPLKMMQLGSWVGDFIPYSAMNSNSYKMLNQHNIANSEETQRFQHHIGFIPRDFETGLYYQPSTVQDRWHAKLYFLKPFLQFSIGFIWLFTGLCSAFFASKAGSYELLAKTGISSAWQSVCLYSASGLNIVLGMTTFLGWRLKFICTLQMITMLFYTAVLSMIMPMLWLDPFGALTKNIPFLVATLVFLAIADNR